MSKFGLSESLFFQIVEVVNCYSEIEWIKIYGSRAIGTYRKTSDIDLAYCSERDITGQVLDDLNQLPTVYRFDLTHYNTIEHEGLKQHIDTFGLPFV